MYSRYVTYEPVLRQLARGPLYHWLKLTIGASIDGGIVLSKRAAQSPHQTVFQLLMQRSFQRNIYMFSSRRIWCMLKGLSHCNIRFELL